LFQILSFTVSGWFARDPVILKRVGKVLLKLRDDNPVKFSRIIIAEDCFKLSSIPSERLTEVLINSIEKLYGSMFLSFKMLYYLRFEVCTILFKI
jgi:hypothetical protein